MFKKFVNVYVKYKMSIILVCTFVVSPLIVTQQHSVAAAVNRTVSFECEVEAFPYAVQYWERKGEILENNDKYSVARIDVSNYDYKFIMQLNISYVNDADCGTYYCVSKNHEGTVAGNITLSSKYFFSKIIKFCLITISYEILQ